MKSVSGPDGKRRLTCRIYTALDIPLLTIYALDMLLEQPNPVDVLLSCNKREIFILSRIDITRYGRYTAHHRVPLIISNEDFQRAQEHVDRMFPEVDL